MSGLNEIELKICEQVTRGLTDEEIGVVLGMTAHKVRNLNSTIRKKLKLDNKVQIAIWYTQLSTAKKSPNSALRGRASEIAS